MIKRQKLANIKQQKGFTLVEVIIVVLIFAIVLAAAYSGLSAFLNLSAATKTANERQQKIIAVLNFIENDFRYIVDRTSRDKYGDFQAPFATERLSQPGAVVELTTLRPDFLYDDVALPQRVSWQIENGRLIREHWLVADQVAESESIRVAFLNDVRSFTVSAKEDKSNINSASGVNSARKLPNGRTLDDIPAAVEVEIGFDDGLNIQRIIEVIASNRL